MAEYIEREAIKYEQWSVGPLNEPLMVVRKKTIDSIPAADVVEVVRCGECVHWDKAGFCHHPAGMSYCGERAEKVGFCYFGERRDDRAAN